MLILVCLCIVIPSELFETRTSTFLYRCKKKKKKEKKLNMNVKWFFFLTARTMDTSRPYTSNYFCRGRSSVKMSFFLKKEKKKKNLNNQNKSPRRIFFLIIINIIIMNSVWQLCFVPLGVQTNDPVCRAASLHIYYEINQCWDTFGAMKGLNIERW